jgi:hypothetical protein
MTRTKRLPPDVLTYRYDSRMACVAPVEDYDQAIDVAVRSFSGLRRFERDRIYLEARVVPSNQHEKKAAKIDRTAWPAVVATLSRFDVVEIRVAPKVTPKVKPKAAPKAVPKAVPMVAAASSSSAARSVVESLPPPYSDAKGSQSQTDLVPYRPSEPQPRALRLHITMELIPSESVRGYHYPQPSRR